MEKKNNPKIRKVTRMHEIIGYSLYDTKAEIYDTPVFFLKEAQAERWFQQLCHAGEGRFQLFKNDMELHRIAYFDLEKGNMKQDEPKLITQGKQIKVEKEIKNEISDETQI